MNTVAHNEPASMHRVGLLAGALIVIVVVAYWPSAAALWRYWIDVPSLGGHGPLVTALAVWMLYASRHRLARAPVSPAPWALLLVLLCSMASLLFWRAGIQAAQLLVLPALMFFAVLAVFGTAVARIVAVPIGYLYFAMPAWNLLSGPLQRCTVEVVRLLAPVLGLPVTITGTEVAFPNGASFIVTPACSGVGFLVEGLAVAVLLGEFEQAPAGRRWRLVAAMVPVALATNWLRVLALLHIGYATGMRHVLVSRVHLEFGWVLFVIVLILFVWLATRRRYAQPEAGSTASDAPAPGPGAWCPSAYLAAVAALVTGPLLFGLVLPAALSPAAAATLRLPTGHGDWRGPTETLDEVWVPVFVGEHSLQRASYQNSAGSSVEIVTVEYALQEQGRELVSEENSVLGGRGLTVVSSNVVEAQGQRYWEVVARDNQGGRSVIWCVYDIGGRAFVIPILSQLWYGARALVAPPYSVLFAFRTACAATCEAARSTLGEFARGMGQEMIAAAARVSRPSEPKAARA